MIVRLKRYTHEPDLLCGEAAALCTGFTGDPLDALRGAIARTGSVRDGLTTLLEACTSHRAD